MNSTAQLLNPSEAAKQLGVSTKALRFYEARGLLKPQRTASGWRVYGRDEMKCATEIVELRALGLSIAEIARVLGGEAPVLARALASHEAKLEARARALNETALKVRRLRGELDGGTLSLASAVSSLREARDAISVNLDLPWPWDGEQFAIPALPSLTYIVGPLGSGKTRLAMRMAEVIPGAVFVGEDRLRNSAAAAKDLLAGNRQLETRVRGAIASIVEAGGNASDALLALVTALEVDGPSVQVVDMLEDGLDTQTQEALICVLRRRAPEARPLICLTRSSSILDLELIGPDELIVLCPANHSPPMLVPPYRGAPGYEALTTCLATPLVRARTAGVVAMRRNA